MLETLVLIQANIGLDIVGVLLVFVRLSAAVAFVPGFGEMYIPVRVKVAVSVALTLIICPLVLKNFSGNDVELVELLFFVTAEILTGVVFGIFLRFLIYSVQICGTIIAQSTSISQIFGTGAAPEPMPAIGNLLTISCIALAMANQLHTKLVLSLAKTYSIVEIGGLFKIPLTYGYFSAKVSDCFDLAISLSSSFLVFFFLVNIGFGVMNRAMPAMMISFVGAPFLTFSGLVLLLIASPLILQIWLGEFERVLANPLYGQ